MLTALAVLAAPVASGLAQEGNPGPSPKAGAPQAETPAKDDATPASKDDPDGRSPTQADLIKKRLDRRNQVKRAAALQRRQREAQDRLMRMQIMMRQADHELQL